MFVTNKKDLTPYIKSWLFQIISKSDTCEQESISEIVDGAISFAITDALRENLTSLIKSYPESAKSIKLLGKTLPNFAGLEDYFLVSKIEEIENEFLTMRNF